MYRIITDNTSMKHLKLIFSLMLSITGVLSPLLQLPLCTPGYITILLLNRLHTVYLSQRGMSVLLLHPVHFKTGSGTYLYNRENQQYISIMATRNLLKTYMSLW